MKRKNEAELYAVVFGILTLLCIAKQYATGEIGWGALALAFFAHARITLIAGSLT